MARSAPARLIHTACDGALTLRSPLFTRRPRTLSSGCRAPSTTSTVPHSPRKKGRTRLRERRTRAFAVHSVGAPPTPSAAPGPTWVCGGRAHLLHLAGIFFVSLDIIFLKIVRVREPFIHYCEILKNTCVLVPVRASVVRGSFVVRFLKIVNPCHVATCHAVLALIASRSTTYVPPPALHCTYEFAS